MRLNLYSKQLSLCEESSLFQQLLEGSTWQKNIHSFPRGNYYFKERGNISRTEFHFNSEAVISIAERNFFSFRTH